MIKITQMLLICMQVYRHTVVTDDYIVKILHADLFSHFNMSLQIGSSVLALLVMVSMLHSHCLQIASSSSSVGSTSVRVLVLFQFILLLLIYQLAFNEQCISTNSSEPSELRYNVLSTNSSSCS